MLDVRGSLQLLNSSRVREWHKALLRSVMVGGVWNVFLLGAPDGDGHLFWGNVPFLLWLRSVKILNFMIS